MDQTKMIDTQADINRTRPDEMSLSDLWAVVVKRKMIIIVLFLISLLGAMLYVFTSPMIYRLETHMKLYLPKDVTTVKELPTAKDLSSIIGTIDPEKKAIIFSKKADEITDLKIVELKGTTDKFKIIIESSSTEVLPEALVEFVKYIENMNMIKSNYEKITRELDEKIKNVKETYTKSDFINREIEKRLRSSNLLSLGFNPIEVNQKVLEMKTEMYRLEQERLNYKLIQPLDAPFISKYPVKPKKTLILTIACLGSLMIGLFIVFVIEYFEKTGTKAQSR
jgi:LPS O-antigen subunit length determinant protein (WzzB/FepE family)